MGLAFTTRDFPAGLTTRFALGCFLPASVFGFAATGLEPLRRQRTSLLLQGTFRGVAARYGAFWRLVAASACPAHTAAIAITVSNTANPCVKDNGLVKLSTGPPQVSFAVYYLPLMAESQHRAVPYYASWRTSISPRNKPAIETTTDVKI
jgi:hypothetical protein